MSCDTCSLPGCHCHCGTCQFERERRQQEAKVDSLARSVNGAMDAIRKAHGDDRYQIKLIRDVLVQLKEYLKS